MTIQCVTMLLSNTCLMCLESGLIRHLIPFDVGSVTDLLTNHTTVDIEKSSLTDRKIVPSNVIIDYVCSAQTTYALRVFSS